VFRWRPGRHGVTGEQQQRQASGYRQRARHGRAHCSRRTAATRAKTAAGSPVPSPRGQGWRSPEGTGCRLKRQPRAARRSREGHHPAACRGRFLARYLRSVGCLRAQADTAWLTARQPDISSKALDQLPLQLEVKEVLKDLQAEVADAYREGFVEMVQAIRQQASVLERIQTTLGILVKHLDSKLEGQLPAAVRVAGDGESPDLATAVVVADPIGAGFTMSQTDIAKALGISQADVSVLLRAFALNKDEKCSVVVRPGDNKQRAVVGAPPASLQCHADHSRHHPGRSGRPPSELPPHLNGPQVNSIWHMVPAGHGGDPGAPQEITPVSTSLSTCDTMVSFTPGCVGAAVADVRVSFTVG
jgi:hypothetical protein